ncbi:MAG: CPBP family intramembrane glutamic endopeptidase [Promethearchaeota archaeon]|jgi:membrane protease YdiL (CAAX protease family)
MIFSETKKRIVKVRFSFFLYEVALVFVFIFLLLIIPLFSVPLIVEEESILYGVLFYGFRAIVVFFGIPLILYLTNLIFESQKSKVIIDEDISPAIGHLRLFKVSKSNYKYQILYGFLIFFLIFLPIDFFTYLFVPDIVSFQSIIFGVRNVNYYLGPFSNNYFIFLISAIIIQISVAITEETISRGLIAKRGSEYFFKMSAVIISSLYFGLGHLGYLLDATSWYPVIWFVQTSIVGIVLAIIVIRKKWILPAIIAHALNNIVATHTVWNYWQGKGFQTVAFFLYIPLFIIGILFTIVCVLLVWPPSSVKNGLGNGFKMFKTYFKRDPKEETKGDTVFRIFIDILIGSLIFLMGLLVAI